MWLEQDATQHRANGAEKTTEARTAQEAYQAISRGESASARRAEIEPHTSQSLRGKALAAARTVPAQLSGAAPRVAESMVVSLQREEQTEWGPSAPDWQKTAWEPAAPNRHHYPEPQKS